MATYETMRVFSSNLSRLLAERDITQLSLANRMDVAPSTVSSWVNGEKMPRMNRIEWMAQFFNVPKSSLLEPYAPQTQREDVLDQVDVAFYGEYKALTEYDKQTIRDMVHVMRQRRK